jgi:hypothetical protein
MLQSLHRVPASLDCLVGSEHSVMATVQLRPIRFAIAVGAVVPERPRELEEIRVREAKRLAAELLNVAPGERVKSHLLRENQLIDVHRTLDRYRAQEVALADLGLEFPVVVVGGSALPIDLGLQPAGEGRPVISSDDIAALIDSTQRDIAQSRYEVTLISLRDASKFLKKGLAKFLRSRMSGKTKDAPTVEQAIRFMVRTESSGLTIHCSPAYFFDRGLVFGGPSTPVEGWLPPGRYVFGAYSEFRSTWRLGDVYKVPGSTFEAHIWA